MSLPRKRPPFTSQYHFGMRWTPFSKPLGDLDPVDIEAVVEHEHEEGVFLEFKGPWTPKGVARTVASFANMPDGGTLIVGIQEDPRKNGGQVRRWDLSTIRIPQRAQIERSGPGLCRSHDT